MLEGLAKLNECEGIQAAACRRLPERVMSSFFSANRFVDLVVMGAGGMNAWN